MGMTDSQFKAFVRLLLMALDDVDQEKDPAKKAAALGQVKQILQQSLED